MIFPQCVQVVLFLVLLCLSTFCCAHRVLIDHTDAVQSNYAHSQGTATKWGYGGGMSRGGGGGVSKGSGGGGGGGMGGSGGYGPRYPPPAASGGGGGGWGWGWDSGNCGGGGTPPCGGGCGPPQPVTCPIGCQPAVHWGYNWPIHAMDYMDHVQSQSAHMSHHGSSSQSKVDMHDAEAQTSMGDIMQDDLSVTEKHDPEPKPVNPSGKGL